MNGRKWLSAALAAFLFFSAGLSAGAELCVPAAGEAEAERETEAPGTGGNAGGFAAVEEKGLALGSCELAYPEVTGLADEALQAAVNERILADTDVPKYLDRISQLISSGTLTVRWLGGVYGEIFSCSVYAEGAVVSPRYDYIWTSANIDLRDGHEITLEELFTDPAKGLEAVTEYLEWNVAPELSAHLLNGNVTPLPERFALTGRGLILLYSRDQWTTLSDRAGDLMIGWNEIEEHLDLSEGSVLWRAGVPASLTMTEESLDALREAAEAGAIPDLPVRLGGSVREAVETWRLLNDPDGWEGGRMFALDGGRFRNVYLLTDDLTEDWDQSVIQGIRLDGGCLFGLRIGQSRAEEWHQELGEPEMTVAFDAEKADAWRTVPGTRDYYDWGGYRLQLHSDAEGVLVSVILTE